MALVVSNYYHALTVSVLFAAAAETEALQSNSDSFLHCVVQ